MLEYENVLFTLVFVLSLIGCFHSSSGGNYGISDTTVATVKIIPGGLLLPRQGDCQKRTDAANNAAVIIASIKQYAKRSYFIMQPLI